MEANPEGAFELMVDRIQQWRATLQDALDETRRQYAAASRRLNHPDFHAKANWEAENLERLCGAALPE